MNKRLTLICSCFLLFAFSGFAQQIVRGKISDASNGTGIPGASILVKGSSSGTSSQPDGSYSLSLPANATTLVVKYLGYLTQEVPINNRSSIDVALVQDAQSLGEVVVTALGIKRNEKSIGYATQTLKGDKLTLTKEQNVLGSLAGKIAGVQVVGSSGASMGGTQKIKIRGVNSLNGDGAPLIVVDGTPISDANFSTASGNGVDLGNISQDINPEDIESINVLKGPTASALYGIRGQNGVIMITTKKGKKGPKSVEVRFNSGLSLEKVSNFIPLQNTYGVGNNQTFLTLANGEKYVNGNDESWGPRMDGTPVRMFYSFYPQDPDFGKASPFVPQPDNIKDFYETGININNSLSISGGNENSSFRLSYNNAYINGTIPNTWLKRNNLSLSSDLKLTDKLTVGVNGNYANNSGQRPVQGYQGSFTGGSQWFQRNIDLSRLRNYSYPDGTILNWNVNPNTTTGIINSDNNKPSDWNNPFFDAYKSLNNDNRDRLFGDVNLNYQVLPELKLSAFVRTDRYIQNISHKEALGGRLDDGYSVGKYQGIDNNYEFLAQYNKQFGEFSINGNFGANLYTEKFTSTFQATVGGLSSPDYYSIAGSIDRPDSRSYERRKEIRSAYAMASLGYKDTYFLDISIRNDNSSALPKSNNSYWYPSVSGSFVFSQLTNWEALSFGKLRASYAVAGSDLKPYQTAYTYSPGSVYKNTTTNINTLYVPDKLNNPFAKPAFAHSFEIGTDLKFLKNRIGFDFSYYNQKNKNQIIDLSVSGASGYTSNVVNAGMIQNHGIEFSLTGTPVQSKFFSWDATLNFNRNKSVIKALYQDLTVYQLDVNTYSSVNIYLNATLNKGFGSLVGQAYQRDPQTGKILLGADNMPLVETNHDFGSVLPKFTGGFMNTFQIGKFDLSAMIDFQSGGQFFSWSKMLAVKSGQAAETAVLNDKGSNVRDPLASGGGVKLNGIYAPGTMIAGQNVGGQEFNGYVDARTYFRNNIGTKIYEEWLYDASYIKLREVSLGYNFSGDLLKKTPFKSAKVAIVARNPVMIWQKAPKGLDPSELSTGSASISWLEKGELQTVRSYGINLNLTF
ncbi:SusC/RagA family TonB-linked outer membrane protein [Pedobacter sp. PACM 27299]|uniref:SusC/RagA family TonB-linked outer membrane protein n=1 Tax=Pedobacter sp. PACM 27299 TaxID=1727164 RepID=UPI0007064A03|nr:SusC/RagA family TonB-linked outer membrane protein [Pedobacter sp. PACM 27299]ALL05349.1 SusC/RagA family TonB-linked outer membrane protein [Pedobacter sp. PACM 27299]